MVSKIAIIDRSQLAANMYRLLLKDMSTTFLVAKRYKDARSWFFGRGRIDLAIVNSNILGSKFEQLYDQFLTDGPFVKTAKIFVCKADEKEAQAKLKKISNTQLLIRPFHPDEFLKAVQKVIS